MSTKPVVRLRLPPGLTETAILFTKLAAAPHSWDVETAAGGTEAQLEFLGLLPCVNTCVAGSRAESAVRSLTPSRHTRFADLPGGTLCLSARDFLAQGCHVRELFPDLSTDYHYPLSLPADAPRAPFADYALVCPPSRARGGEAWTPEQWAILCSELDRRLDVPWFLLGPSTCEQALRSVYKACGRPPGRLLTTRHLAYALALIKGARYVWAPATALGVLTGVLGTPHAALFDYHAERLLRGSYTDPRDVVSGYTHLAWLSDGPYAVAAESLQRYGHLASSRVDVVPFAAGPLSPDDLPIDHLERAEVVNTRFVETLREASRNFRLSSFGLVAAPMGCAAGEPDRHYGYLHALGKVLGPRTLLEVGVGHGHGLYALLSGAFDAGIPVRAVGGLDLVALDYTGFVLRSLMARCAPPPALGLVVGDAATPAPWSAFPVSEFELIHVDLGPSPGRTCVRDVLRLAWRRLAVSGTLVINYSLCTEAEEAFQELVSALGHTAVRAATCCGWGVLRKFT